MKTICLLDAACQVEQAQSVLPMWLELTTKDDDPELPRLIGSILTLLHGVPEAIGKADAEMMVGM